MIVFHAVHPERSTNFIEEGTAVAFDLTRRDRLGEARLTLKREGMHHTPVLDLWKADRSNPAFYAVAGAFVDRLIARAGREKFLALLKTQTIDAARSIYGADFDRLVAEFDADLTAPAQTPAPAPSTQPSPAAAENPDVPAIETLQARAQERMRRDREMFSIEEMRQIEALYQSANRDMKAPGSRDVLRQLIEKYPRSNRAGCAALYLAVMTPEAADREKHFLDVVKNHADAMYGDGVQVGAMARAELVFMYTRNGRIAEAQKLAEEVDRLYPGAVDHRGRRLADGMRRLLATPAAPR